MNKFYSIIFLLTITGAACNSQSHKQVSKEQILFDTTNSGKKINSTLFINGADVLMEQPLMPPITYLYYKDYLIEEMPVTRQLTEKGNVSFKREKSTYNFIDMSNNGLCYEYSDFSPELQPTRIVPFKDKKGATIDSTAKDIENEIPISDTTIDNQVYMRFMTNEIDSRLNMPYTNIIYLTKEPDNSCFFPFKEFANKHRGTLAWIETISNNKIVCKMAIDTRKGLTEQEKAVFEVWIKNTKNKGNN